MKLLTDLTDLKGQKVFVRVDWNVPMEDGKVVDDFRIRKSMPTLDLITSLGGELIIATHLEKGTTAPLEEFVPKGAKLLPNLRENPGEEANSEEFAQELAALADIYVNEAFPVSHRKHASIVRLPKLLPSYAGLCLAQEVEQLSKAFYPKRPFLFIIGGAKFDTKFPLLRKFINIADEIFVGGALANNFLKETGVDVGKSLVTEGKFPLQEMLDTGKIILPADTIVKDDKILDIGPMTLEKLEEKIQNAQLIVWNGPLGFYELGYRTSTLELAKLIAASKAETIVGGGDTLAAIEELNLFDKFTFVSTGGGAMLDFLANGGLPGIEALG